MYIIYYLLYLLFTVFHTLYIIDCIYRFMCVYICSALRLRRKIKYLSTHVVFRFKKWCVVDFMTWLALFTYNFKRILLENGMYNICLMYEKTAASVLLELFISSNKWCHKTLPCRSNHTNTMHHPVIICNQLTF